MTHAHATARRRRILRAAANLRRQIERIPGLSDALDAGPVVDMTEDERRLVDRVLPRLMALVAGDPDATRRLAGDLFPDATEVQP